jgi:SAM-dependent methyltransferase
MSDRVKGTTTGSAAAQALLWGARADDWATFQEAMLLPMFETILHRTAIGLGIRVLDIGCGAGRFPQEAARLGAQVTGLDAAQPMLDIAASRTPGGTFVQGEVEDLPFDDQSFDVVTGFNSFQYAANRTHALEEARRVARPGAPVVIVVWGAEADCELASYVYALGKRLPPPPAGAPGPFALSEPGVLRALAEGAGLRVSEEADVACPSIYADEALALRGLLSAGPAVRAIAAAGEDTVRADVLHAIAPYRTADGGYTLQNKFRYVIASS